MHLGEMTRLNTPYWKDLIVDVFNYFLLPDPCVKVFSPRIMPFQNEACWNFHPWKNWARWSSAHHASTHQRGPWCAAQIFVSSVRACISLFAMCVCKAEKGTWKCQLLGSVRSCVNTCFLRRKNSATVIRGLEIKYLQTSPLLVFNWEKHSDLQEHASALLIRWWCLHVMYFGCFCAALKYFFPLNTVVGSASFHQNVFSFLTESRYIIYHCGSDRQHRKCVPLQQFVEDYNLTFLQANVVSSWGQATVIYIALPLKFVRFLTSIHSSGPLCNLLMLTKLNTV